MISLQSSGLAFSVMYVHYFLQSSSDIENLSKCDEFVALSSSASVYDAVKAMVDKKVHRVVIMDDEVCAESRLMISLPHTPAMQ